MRNRGISRFLNDKLLSQIRNTFRTPFGHTVV